MSTRHLLAADIGGTNSRFALFSLQESPAGLELALRPGSKVVLPTAAFDSFRELLEQLAALDAPGGFRLLPGATGRTQPFQLAAMSLAVPGAVLGSGSAGRCAAPNIKWPLAAADAAGVGGVPAALLNDFAAQGLACLFPEILGLREVLPGAARPASPAVVVGAGTGLGKAIILPRSRAAGCAPAIPGPDAARVFLPSGPGGAKAMPDLASHVLPSEGGHAIFPFNGRREAEFQEFLLAATGRREAIGDMVVSGPGLSALHAFHSGSRSLLPPPEVTPGLTKESPELEWLARFYGRACRNLVLETLALGGVYLSGGLLSHVPGLLGHPAFGAEFRASESQAPLLARVPVSWVSNQESGLWGAALHGLTLLAGC